MPVTRQPNFDRVVKRVVNEIQSGVRDAVAIAEREVKQRYSGPTGPFRLGVRTGRLRAAVRNEVKGGPPPRPVVARVYIRHTGSHYDPVYAAIHETGGVIRARRVPYLKFQPGRRGAAGRGGRWVSVRQVRIPRRPVWEVSRRAVEPKIRRRFERGIDRAVRAA